MAKAKDLRDQSLDELIANKKDQQKLLFQLINERAQTKKFDKPHRIRMTKRDIARCETIIRQKEQNSQ